MRFTQAIFSALAAGVVMACTPVPALALTQESCKVHATFAFALREETVTADQLNEWVLKQSAEDREYFNQIAQTAVENAEAIKAMTSVQFGNAVLEMCEAAVVEATI